MHQPMHGGLGRVQVEVMDVVKDGMQDSQGGGAAKDSPGVVHDGDKELGVIRNTSIWLAIEAHRSGNKVLTLQTAAGGAA